LTIDQHNNIQGISVTPPKQPSIGYFINHKEHSRATMLHPIRSGSTDDEVNLEESVPQEVVSSAASSKKTPVRRRKKAQSQSPPAKDMIPLSPDFTPGRLDVICSRGKFAYNSPGYVHLTESLNSKRALPVLLLPVKR
jgi:hypothetical protein